MVHEFMLICGLINLSVVFYCSPGRLPDILNYFYLIFERKLKRKKRQEGLPVSFPYKQLSGSLKKPAKRSVFQFKEPLELKVKILKPTGLYTEVLTNKTTVGLIGFT